MIVLMRSSPCAYSVITNVTSRPWAAATDAQSSCCFEVIHSHIGQGGRCFQKR